MEEPIQEQTGPQSDIWKPTNHLSIQAWSSTSRLRSTSNVSDVTLVNPTDFHASYRKGPSDNIVATHERPFYGATKYHCHCGKSYTCKDNHIHQCKLSKWDLTTFVCQCGKGYEDKSDHFVHLEHCGEERRRPVGRPSLDSPRPGEYTQLPPKARKEPRATDAGEIDGNYASQESCANSVSSDSPCPTSISSKSGHHQLQQVGIARVYIQIIRLGAYHDSCSELDDDEHLSEMSIVTTQTATHDSGENDRSSDDRGEGQSDSSHEAQAPSSFKGLETRKRSRGKEEDEDREEDGSHKRPCRRSKPPNSAQSGMRLACPYQAYDMSQLCLAPSSKNPLGGCESISRLRQHIQRTHMPSMRCNRCWRSFDKKEQKEEHEAMPTACDHRGKPPASSMMDEDQETEFKATRWSGPEDSSWWSIFKLLIPGMSKRGIDSLKAEYYPYYVRLDSFMIPALTFPNTVFQPPQAPEASELSDCMDDNTAFSQEIDWSLFNNETPNMPLTAAHTLEVPLFEVPNPDFSIWSSSRETEQSSNTNNVSLGEAPGSGFWTQSPASSAPLMTNAPSSDNPQPTETVLRRNCDRLRARLTKTERENEGLHETAQQTRSSLNQMDAVLEELLNAENIPEFVYSKIAEVSSMVASLKDKP